MALKDTLARLNDINLNEIDLNDLDLSSAGLWPGPVKVICGIALGLVLSLAGYFFLITDLQSELARVVQQESTLKSDYAEKYRQSALSLIHI